LESVVDEFCVTKNEDRLLKIGFKNVLVNRSDIAEDPEIDSFTESVSAAEQTATQSPMSLRERVSEYFLALRNPVYGYLARFCGSPAEAEELTQEAFLKLYRHLLQGKKVENVKSWVFQVARNLAVDRTRTRSSVEEAVEISAAADIPSEGASSEEMILEHERDERLRVATKELTDFQRQCLHLRAEGLRYREIAETLSTSVDSVADALQRAIRKLRDRMHE